MVDMEINSTATFHADPDRVAAMMSDPAWWQDVYRRVGATTSNESRHGEGVSLDMALPAPSQVRRFVGETLAAHQETAWGAPDTDGSRQGTLTIVPKGMPARAEGIAVLRPVGEGTEVTYRGTFTVSIPLVGGKIEKAAGPHITRAFDVQQEAGNEWLASH